VTDRKSAAPRRTDSATSAALLAQLAMNLERGYWRVAIRRYLMLVARGVDIPQRYGSQCEALMATCPSGDLRRIESQVHSWVAMLAAPAQRRRPRDLSSACDKYPPLDALWRRGPASSP
jgi:hypothetical protein